MPNPFLLRDLKAQGLLQGSSMTFAGRQAAERYAERADLAVMHMDALNEGKFWVVGKEDADRLQAAGHERIFG